ncbi:MAG: hypothetical protein HYY01_08690 [Chloroflexi bacterium]|nr:hypothetical protein [Chloroflexota bacterium]
MTLDPMDRLVRSWARLKAAKKLLAEGPDSRGLRQFIRRETTILLRRAARVLWLALKEWGSARSRKRCPYGSRVPQGRP